MIDRIALRDRPILDRFQSRIFRLPLDRQVILFGPPGSAKTTTLIRRLAQKRTPEALSEYDQQLLVRYAPGTFERSDSWAMSSPGELLKRYLGNAFNLVGIPDADNVRTWEKERLHLARNVLSLLRSPNNTGRFQYEENPAVLSAPSSRGIAALHDGFAAYAEASLLRRCNEAFASLAKSADDHVRRQVSRLQRTLGGERLQELDQILQLLDRAGELQAEIRRLGDLIANALNDSVNRFVAKNKPLALIGTLLGLTLSPLFFAVPLFVGGGLLVAGLTGFCGMARLLQRAPWNRTAFSAR